MLDGLNLLRVRSGAEGNLRWLPLAYPPGVRVVLSTLSATPAPPASPARLLPPSRVQRASSFADSSTWPTDRDDEVAAAATSSPAREAAAAVRPRSASDAPQSPLRFVPPDVSEDSDTEAGNGAPTALRSPMLRRAIPPARGAAATLDRDDSARHLRAVAAKIEVRAIAPPAPARVLTCQGVDFVLAPVCARGRRR